MNERVALLLSLNFTARKLLKIKIPIVCDGLFFGMDLDIISGIFSESLKENTQLIILEYPSFWKKLQVKPT